MTRLRFSPLAPLGALAILLAMACDSTPRHDVEDAGVVPDGAAATCGPFSALDGLALAEGGRLVIAREGALADPTLALSTDGGISVVATDPDRILVYADYGATAGTLRVACADGGAVDAPVAVHALAWSTLSDWEPGTDGPPGREYGAFWLGDRGPHALYVFGGFHYEPVQFTPAWDLWRFDLSTNTWSELETTRPPMTPGGRAAPGAMPGTILYHGGGLPALDGSIDTPPVLASLAYDGEDRAWEEAPFAARSPGSYTGALVRDARRDRWLSICGADSRSLGIHCAVSEYTETDGWQRISVAEGELPAGRFGFHYGYDEENDRVVIASGQVGGGNLDMIGDTWALELAEDPPRWVELVPEEEGIRRRNGAFVVDPEGRRLLMWGGTADGADSVRGLYALGLDRGRETWTRLDIPDEVPSRTSGLAVYDPEDGRALFGFGNDDAVYTDLYALSLR